MKNLRRCLPLLFGCTLGLGTQAAEVSNTDQADDPYARMVAAFERAPIRNLESAYLRCARESEQRLLRFDEAAACSIASEVLKKRRFGGDFDAMLAWWKAHRTDANGTGSAEAGAGK